MKKRYIIILLFLILLITGCSDRDLNKIKNGTLELCKDYTIDELVNNYLDKPEWSVTKSDKGYSLYNVKGNAYYDHKESEFLIQFAFSDNDIILKDFEIDKSDGNGLTYIQLINDMCKTTKLKKEGTTKTIKNVEVKLLYNAEAYDINEDLVPKSVDITLYGLSDQIDEVMKKDLYVSLPVYNYSIGNNQKVYFEFDISKDIIAKIKPEYVTLDISKRVITAYTPQVSGKKTIDTTKGSTTQREVIKKIELKNLANNLKADIVTEKDTTIYIKGYEKDVYTISDNDIHAYVDLNGLNTGDYDVQIIVSGPNNNLIYTPKISTAKVRISNK